MYWIVILRVLNAFPNCPFILPKNYQKNQKWNHEGSGIRIVKFLPKCKCKAMRISFTPCDTNLCVDSGSLVPGSSCVRRAPRNQQRCPRRSKHTQKTNTHTRHITVPISPSSDTHQCSDRITNTTNRTHNYSRQSADVSLHWDMNFTTFCQNLFYSWSWHVHFVYDSKFFQKKILHVSVQYFIRYKLLFMTTYCHIGTGFPKLFCQLNPFKLKYFT